MNIAIVDDQQVETRLLSKYIDKYSNEFGIDNLVISSFKSAAEFLDSFTEGSHTVAFLDILMDKMNGVELARKMREIDESIKIVFCTSTNEFAAESYEVNASMYLLKPYSYEQFKVVMKNVLPKQHEALLSVLLQDGQRVIPRNILYTEYFNHKITIHSKVGDDIYVRSNQALFEDAFRDYDFIIPCNRGIIINLLEVRSFDGTSVTLVNGNNLPVSRSHANDVKEAFEKLKMQRIKDNL